LRRDRRRRGRFGEVIRVGRRGEPDQTPDEKGPMSDAERVLRTYAERFGRGDVDSLAAMYAARTDYHQPFSPEPMTSPEAVKDFESAIFAAFSDIVVELEWIVAGGREGAAGARIRATHTSAMPAPGGGEIPATNR